MQTSIRCTAWWVLNLAAFLLLGHTGAAAEAKPGRYTGTMTIRYLVQNTGDLGVSNKVTFKVSGEGNPSSDPVNDPGIILYLLAPPAAGEFVPAYGKIASLNFRATPVVFRYSDSSVTEHAFSLPEAFTPKVKGDSIVMDEVAIASTPLNGFSYQLFVSLRVKRVR